MRAVCEKWLDSSCKGTMVCLPRPLSPPRLHNLFLFDAVCDTLKLRLHNVQQAKMMSAVCATQNQTFWMSLQQKDRLFKDCLFFPVAIELSAIR